MSVSRKIYRNNGGFDGFSHVDQLLKTWHAEGYVLRANTSKMEGVEGHLSCGLTDRLSSDSSYHLARMGDRGLELRHDFAKDEV